MAEPFSGPIPPAPPIGRVQIVDEEGRATQAFADWLAKLIYYLKAPNVLRMQDVYDPPSLGPNAVSPVQTMTVPGAKIGGDEVIATFSQPLQGIVVNGWVSATDQVSYQFVNPRPATVNLASGIIRLRVRSL